MKPRKEIPSFWREMDEETAWLHLGENPFPPTPRVLRATEAASLHGNRYPDTQALALRQALARYVGHGTTAQNILVGNGSDELIDLAVVAFTQPGEAVVHMPPDFFVFAFCAERHHRRVLPIPRTDTFDVPTADTIHQAIAEQPVTLSFIANPNNPTGTLTPRTPLMNATAALPGIRVVDECYYEFCGETLADRIHDDPSLVVFRSLSKSFGFSGLRLGYAVAHEETIEHMERFAMTFPVNCIAQSAGLAALQDADRYRERIQLLVGQREWLRGQLQSMGLRVLPGAANFVLALWPQPVEPHPADILQQAGILVSDQSAAIGTGAPALRIAIGTTEQNQRVVKALQGIGD